MADLIALAAHDRHRAVLDRMVLAVAIDQHDALQRARSVRPPADHGQRNLGAALFVDKLHHLRQRYALRIVQAPSSQPLRRRIEKRDATVDVGRDDRFVDRVERHFDSVTLAAELGFD